MSLTYTSLVGIPGANGAQTQREHPNSTQKKILGQNQTTVLTTALPRQSQCEMIPLKGSCSYTLYTLGVTAEDGSAMRSSITGMAQFGTVWNWQAGEEDQKRRFMDVAKEDTKQVGTTEEV